MSRVRVGEGARVFQEDLDEASLREVRAHVGFLVARANLDHLLGRFVVSRGQR